jgi:hypothetical protein
VRRGPDPLCPLPAAMTGLTKGFVRLRSSWPLLRQTGRSAGGRTAWNACTARSSQPTKAVGAFPDRPSVFRLIVAVALKATTKWGDRWYVEVGFSRARRSVTEPNDRSEDATSTFGPKGDSDRRARPFQSPR